MFWTAQSLVSKQNALFLSLVYCVGRRSYLGFFVRRDKTHHADHRPPAAPLPLQQNCPLGRRRPGRRLARGPPPIGPLLATSPWSSTGPCRCLRSLSNRDSWVGVCVLTADRRHPPHTDRLEQPPTDIPRRTHVDDCQPPILSITGDQDRKEETQHSSMSLRTAALSLARAAARRPFSTTMASPSASTSSTPMADTIREKVTSPPPHHISLSPSHIPQLTPSHPSPPPSSTPPFPKKQTTQKKSLNS